MAHLSDQRFRWVGERSRSAALPTGNIPMNSMRPMVLPFGSAQGTPFIGFLDYHCVLNRTVVFLIQHSQSRNRHYKLANL
jgi:hypothetical protein